MINMHYFFYVFARTNVCFPLFNRWPLRGLLVNTREKKAEKEPGLCAPAILSYHPTDSLGSPHLSMSLALSNSPLS